MTRIQAQRDALVQRLRTEPVRPWLTAGRALAFAFLAFNAISGLIMVTWPMMVLAWRNLVYRVWEPLLTWLWRDPSFGWELRLCLGLAVIGVAWWLARDVLRLWALEGALLAVRLWDARPWRERGLVARPAPEREQWEGIVTT